jgi:hypothetical protein
MATGPTLPPQAYTREMLTTAFNWLQTQPDSVRKMATSPDTLVCLYTRAQRSGATLLDSEAPVSSQNFMSDLKNLAEGLRAFDEPAAAAPVKPRPTPISANNPSPQKFAGAQVTPLHQPVAEDHRFFERHQPQQAHLSPATPQGPALNERSIAMIQEVKGALNLSSDSEVANLMMALAYKNLKNLLA